jgi:hypothetical protein
VTPITSSCAYGTADRSRLRWRVIGLVAGNLALWGGITLLFVKACS